MSESDDMESFYGFENTEQDFQDEQDEEIRQTEERIDNGFGNGDLAFNKGES